jgi:hypothetical protein
MFISLQKKILFFHISKTAGTSVTQMLDKLCPDYEESYRKLFHSNIGHYMTKRVTNRWGDWEDQDRFIHITQTDARPFFKAANIDYSDFFCFIIVRNPYDRLRSQMEYMNLLKYNSVDYHIDHYQTDLNIRKAGYWFKSQMEYFRDPMTKNINVFKYEDLDKLWLKLKEFDDDNKLKIMHLNPTSIETKDTIRFSTKQKKKIYNMFKEEFDTFGYHPGFPVASNL